MISDRNTKSSPFGELVLVLHREKVGCGGRISSRPYHARVEESRLKLVAGARNHRGLTLPSVII